MTLIYCCCKVK